MARKYEIKWAKVALDDLDDIVDYIAREDNAYAAMAVHDMIWVKANSLMYYPERGRIVPELRALGVNVYRELVVKPYRIFFCIKGRVIAIVGILDSRRDLEELLIDRMIRS